MNVFVLKGVLKDVSVQTIFKGVTPFWVADIFRIILLALVPGLALFLALDDELTPSEPERKRSGFSITTARDITKLDIQLRLWAIGVSADLSYALCYIKVRSTFFKHKIY